MANGIYIDPDIRQREIEGLSERLKVPQEEAARLLDESLARMDDEPEPVEIPEIKVPEIEPPKPIERPPIERPKAPRITSGYGEMSEKRTRPHQGIDIAMPIGQPIPSLSSGTITKIVKEDDGDAGGLRIYVRDDAGVETRYMHASRFPEGIEIGAQIAEGQPIMFSGDTGRVTGPHLHLETGKVESGGKFVRTDPGTVYPRYFSAAPGPKEIPEHLQPDFKLEIPTLLTGLEFARRRVTAGRGEESSISGRIERHALEIGIDVKRLREAAGVQGISLGYMVDEVGKKGRSAEEVIQEAKDRGIYAFLDPEQRAARKKRGALGIEKAVAEFRETGDHTILLDEFGNDVYNPGEAMPFLGGQAIDFADVAKPDEQMYQAASLISDAIMNDNEASKIVDAFSEHYNGAKKYADKRAQQYLKKNNLTPASENYAEMERKFRDRAVREVVALKTVGMWTGPIIMSEEELLESFANKDLSDRFFDALKPTLEVVGIRKIGADQTELVVREENPLLYFFNLIDMTASAAVGALSTEGDMLEGAVEGMESRRNPFEAAIDSEFAEKNAATKTIAFIGGGLITILSPDLLVGAGGVAKLTSKLLGVVTTNRAAKRGSQLLADLSVARGAEDYEKASELEATLRREFTERGGLADLLDTLDMEAAHLLAKNNPEMLDGTFIQKLNIIDASLVGDSSIGPRALALHPSFRKPRLTSTQGSGGAMGVSYGGEGGGLYETRDILAELNAAKNEILASGTGGKLTQLQAVTEKNIRKIERLVDSTSEPEGAQFIARLKASLADAIDDPKAWEHRFHGEGNLESELAQITVLRGPTQEQMAAAVGDELRKLQAEAKLSSGRRKKIHNILGKITSKAKNVEDPLVIVDRAIETVKANNEARGIAAKLLSETLSGSRKLKPVTGDPRIALPKGAVALSGEANVLANKLGDAYDITDEQARALASIMDARARAWGTANGKQASEYFTANISKIVKGEDVRKPLFEMNEVEGGLVEITTKEIKDANGFGLMFRVQDDVLSVKTVELPPNLRGQGIGAALYGRALQHAKSLGKGFASDVSPSPDAINVYEKLIKRGAPIRRRQVDLPDGTSTRQYIASADDLAKANLKGIELITSKPAVDVASDGRAVLNAFVQPTLTGAIRGMAHVFRRDIDPDDLKVIEEWCGVKNRRWTEVAEEKWARGFESYLAEGIVPNNAVQTVFDKFKVWITETYRGVVGSPIDEQIPDNIRRVMDRLLTEQPPVEPPFKRTLEAMSLGSTSQIVETNVDPLMELAKAARSQGLRNSEPKLILSSLEQNGAVVFTKPVEINGVRKKVWTEGDIAELQLNMESKSRVAKQMEDAPEITLRDVPKAEATEAIDERILAAVGGDDALRRTARLAVYTVLGGDNVGVVMRRLRPEHRHSAEAASRSAEQAIGDAITHVSETGSKGGMERLFQFLGGVKTKFRTGRDALSSGDDFISLSMLTMENTIQALAKVKTQVRGPDGKKKTLLDFLGDMAEATDGPEGFKKGYEAFMGVKSNQDEMGNIFKVLKSKDNQMYADLMESFYQGQKMRPEEAQYLKLMMEATGLHIGKVTDLKGAEKAEAMFEGIEKIYGRESALRASVLLAAHGQAARSRTIWAGLGLAIDQDTMKAWRSWLNGETIDPEIIPRMHEMMRNYGMRPEFVDDAVMEAGFYVPKAAREKLTNALAKAKVVDDPEKMTGLKEVGSFAKFIYTYMKTRMTRGGFFVRQRYFLMNTVDHFSQMAMVSGYRPALVSTVRVATQNVMVLPGVAHTLSLVDKVGGAQTAENLRKVLQSGGDAAANAVGRMLNVSKYRIEVNPILEGVARDGSRTFRLVDPETGQARFYNYDDIRRIAVEEGVFASFDTRELQRSIKTGMRVEADAFFKNTDGIGSAAGRRVKETLGFFTDNVAKTAEAWSERERIGALVTLMEIGMEPRQAARLVIDGLFDYAGSMSKIDKNMVVSALFPFWAFQKNANRLILRQLATPAGAYRMGVLRRSYTTSAEAITELLYERVADPYGIDADRMPPELQDKYYFLRNMIENGYGPLEDLKSHPEGSVIIESIEEEYGPIESIDPEKRKILEQGYGGYSNTPRDIRDALRLSLAGNADGFVEELESKGKAGQMVSLAGKLRERMQQIQPMTEEGEMFSDFYNAKPGESARRNFHRDRVGIGIKAAMTEDTRKFLRMVRNDPVTGFNDVYLDILYPDSTIYAGFRHAAAAIALPIIGLRAMFVDEDAAVHNAMIRSALDMMGDPLDSPMPNLVASAFTDRDMRPRRLNVELAKNIRMLKDMGIPLPTVTIVDAVKDEFAPAGEQIIEQERAYMSGGTGSMLFSLTPLGELNDIMTRLEKAPIQERMGMQGELLQWAEVVLGLQVVETSRQVSAKADAPKFETITPTLPMPK